MRQRLSLRTCFRLHGVPGYCGCHANAGNMLHHKAHTPSGGYVPLSHQLTIGIVHSIAADPQHGCQHPAAGQNRAFCKRAAGNILLQLAVYLQIQRPGAFLARADHVCLQVAP